LEEDKMRTQKARVNLLLEDDEFDELKAAAKYTGMSMTNIASMACRLGLKAVLLSFDPSYKGLFEQANEVIDRALENDQKDKAKSQGDGRPGISKIGQLAK